LAPNRRSLCMHLFVAAFLLLLLLSATCFSAEYGDMKVRDAINKLTPPSENDTKGYLAQLKAAGIDLDKDVKSQIDTLMKAVEANEGLIQGTEVARVP